MSLGRRLAVDEDFKRHARVLACPRRQPDLRSVFGRMMSPAMAGSVFMAAVTVVVACLSATVEASAAVTLTRDGKATCVIVTGRDDGAALAHTMRHSEKTNQVPSNLIAAAAADLAEHVGEIAGIWDPRSMPPVVQTVKEAKAPFRLLLGTAAIEEHGLQKEAARLAYPSYIYRVVGNDLLIFGSSSKGTANGVYGFLQDELGVRWFGPQDLFRVVPKMPTIEVGPLDKTVAPSFLGRRVSVESRIEHPAYFWGRRRMRGLEPTDEGELFRNTSHNIELILPPARYFASNPEYYGMRRGVRQSGSAFAACWSNPAVIDLAAQAALSYFKASPRHQCYSLGINDGTAYCECPECAKVQPARSFRGARVASDMYFQFVNEVARRVKAEFPGRYVGVIAYNDVTAPPVGPVEENVHVVLVNDISEYYDPQYRALDEKLVTAWREKDVTMGLYYYTELAKLVPAYFPRLLAAELKDKHARGFTSITTEMGNGWPWQGPMAYVEARLFWNVDLSVDELLDEYFKGLFGAAAQPMKALYELFEEIHMRPRAGGFLYEHYKPIQFRPYTGEDLELIRGRLAAAHRSLAGLGVGYSGHDGREALRVAYVSNGLKVFLDMLEGYALVDRLDGMAAKDDLSAMEMLETVARLNVLLDRHETLFRETLLLDEYLPRRFRYDTCTPVRNAWKGTLSTAIGNALAGLYTSNRSGPGLAPAVKRRLEKEVEGYTQKDFNRALFNVRTGIWRLGPNTAPNPGFEEVWGEGAHSEIPSGQAALRGRPHGWDTPPNIVELGGVAGTIEHSPPDPVLGRRSARLALPGARPYFLAKAAAVTPGQSYLCSVEATLSAPELRGESRARVYMLVRWFGDGWMYSDDFLSSDLSGLNERKTLETVAVAPPGARSLSVFLYAENLQGGEEALFDNISVRRILDE